jgi:hypothetical protein
MFLTLELSLRGMDTCVDSSYLVLYCFLEGDSPASEIYVQTFRNTLYLPSS